MGVQKHRLSGKEITDHIANNDDTETLQDFIQDKFECNEVYFLKYLTNRILDDYGNSRVPFADYVQRQSHSFPADEFRKEGIDGGTYCEKDSKFLLSFLRKQCGFRVGTSRPLIANIDKYPH